MLMFRTEMYYQNIFWKAYFRIYCSSNGLKNNWHLIYLTTIVLTPSGSSTVYIYTQIIHRTIQLIWEECGLCPLFVSYTLYIDTLFSVAHIISFHTTNRPVLHSPHIHEEYWENTKHATSQQNDALFQTTWCKIKTHNKETLLKLHQLLAVQTFLQGYVNFNFYQILYQSLRVKEIMSR
jgi:hypothetical protein